VRFSRTILGWGYWSNFHLPWQSSSSAQNRVQPGPTNDACSLGGWSASYSITGLKMMCQLLPNLCVLRQPTDQATPFAISQFGVGHWVHMWPQAMNFGNYKHYLAKRKRKASEVEPGCWWKKATFPSATALKSVSTANGSTVLDGNGFGFVFGFGFGLHSYSHWLFSLLFLRTFPQSAIFDQVHFS